MLKKIGRLIYYSLFLLTPLIVLKDTSELFELNKINYIYFSSVSISLILAIAMVRARKIFIRRSAFDIIGLVFIGVMLLSTLFSIDQHVSIFGYYGRFNGGFLSLLSYSVLFYGLGFFFVKKDILKILMMSTISSVIVMLWGLSGKFGHDFSCLLFTGQFSNSCWTDQFRPAERMFSTLGQPNWLGAYLAIHFFIGLYFLVTKHFKRWYLSYSYLLLTFICLLSTKSRSALLAVGVGSLLYALIIVLLKQKDIFFKEKNKLLGLGLLFLLSIVFFKTGIDKIDNLIRFPIINNESSNKLEITNSKSSNRPLSSEVTESLDIRKIVWKGAIDLGFRYPLLGTGPETFGLSYYFTRPIEHNTTSEWDYVYNKAHNEYLNYFATTGFVGLLSYLILVVVVLYNLSRFLRIEDPDSKSGKFDRLLYLSLLCSYVTILITNFFGFSTTTINLFFFIIPAFVALSHSSTKDYFDFKEDNIHPSQKIEIGLAVVVYLFCLVWLITFFVADTQYAQGLLYEASGDYIKASQLVTTATLLRPDPVYLDKLSYLEANLALIASSQGEKDLVTKFITNSIQSNQKSRRSSPKNIQYLKTAAKNNLLFYQVMLERQYIEMGISNIQSAVILAPTEPKLAYTEAVFYSILADDSEDKIIKQQYRVRAIISAQRAIDLKSDYTIAKDFLKKIKN